MSEELPDGMLDHMRTMLAHWEDLEASFGELRWSEGVRWYRRPAYWLLTRRVKRQVREIGTEVRLMEKVARADAGFPVHLTPDEISLNKKTGGPLVPGEELS